MNAEQFEALLDEYRAQNIHFLHLKTNTRDWFFIIDDSYYLTYRDDKKEIVVSWLVKPKDDKHEEFYFYNTNNRGFNQWYGDVIHDFEAMDDKEFYHEPYYEDLYINYMNEDEKVPLKDFLAVIPRTNYKIFGSFLLCDEIGSGLDKKELPYKTDNSTIANQFKFWLRMEDIAPFNYILREPVKCPAINLAEIEEIIPAHTNVRFVFDDGSVRALKQILADKNSAT